MSQFRVVRPDGSVIPCAPGIHREDALWNAREHDERLARIVQPNRTNNVTQAKRAGYDFEDLDDSA